jgi:hypothetical protein
MFLAMSRHPAVRQLPEFDQFVGPPLGAVAHLGAFKSGGGLNTRSVTAIGAEREATAVRGERFQGCRRVCASG